MYMNNAKKEKEDFYLYFSGQIDGKLIHMNPAYLWTATEDNFYFAVSFTNISQLCLNT
jgi:hypothetical protein